MEEEIIKGGKPRRRRGKTLIDSRRPEFEEGVKSEEDSIKMSGELNEYQDGFIILELTEENETASCRTHTVASRSAACYPVAFSCSAAVLEHYTSHPVHIATSLPATQMSLPVPGGKTFLSNVMARMLERARSKEEFRKNKVIADEARIKDEQVKVVPDVVEQQRERERESCK